MKLYLVTDEELLLGKELFQTVEAAVKGGVTMVQLREKNSSTRDFICKAIRLKEILAPYRVPLLINDRIDVALAADADGVHIGQSDMPYQLVKKLLPAGKIVGLSVETHQQVLEANQLKVDYIAASPVYVTTTKTDTITEWGLEGIRWIKSVSRHPLVGIGRMNKETIPDAFRAGLDSAAVISAIISAPDPEKAASELSALVNPL
ncbi:MAG: thiamine phosphate synthase [Bacteroides sp.]|nr:thiamine phosphate synthase [Bacteroides sp.]